VSHAQGTIGAGVGNYRGRRSILRRIFRPFS